MEDIADEITVRMRSNQMEGLPNGRIDRWKDCQMEEMQDGNCQMEGLSDRKIIIWKYH